MSYNPYVENPWLTYLLYLDLPKMKPNVGYWPRGRSTSAPAIDIFIPHWRDVYASVREAEENYAYHRHQQHITDEFRAKLNFANRIILPTEEL